LEVMETGEAGNTAVHLAAQGGHAKVIKALTGKGADANALNSAGQAPLHCAVYHTGEVVEALAAAKADVDVKDKEGETPLHYGLWFQNEYAIRALLTAKASVQEQNKKKQSPLELARSFCLSRTILKMVENPLTAPKRKRVMPNPKLPYLKEGMKAVYEPTSEDVEVVQVHRDGEEEPYFTVKMPDGNEKQTTLAKLKPHDTGEPELKRRKTAELKKNNVYVVGLPTDDPLMNGYFLEKYFGKCGKVANTKLYRTKEGLKGDALVTFGKESEAEAAVKKLHKSEIRAGHIISVTIANFGGTGAAKAPEKVGTSRWGAQKVAPRQSQFMPGTVGIGGLQGILPQGIMPQQILSKQQMAAQKAAEIARQIESLKGVLGKK